jgi:hypothetical protein
LIALIDELCRARSTITVVGVETTHEVVFAHGTRMTADAIRTDVARSRVRPDRAARQIAEALSWRDRVVQRVAASGCDVKA